MSVISTGDLQNGLSDLRVLMVGPTGELNDEPSDTTVSTVVTTGDSRDGLFVVVLVQTGELKDPPSSLAFGVSKGVTFAEGLVVESIGLNV